VTIRFGTSGGTYGIVLGMEEERDEVEVMDQKGQVVAVQNGSSMVSGRLLAKNSQPINPGDRIEIDGKTIYVTTVSDIVGDGAHLEIRGKVIDVEKFNLNLLIVLRRERGLGVMPHRRRVEQIARRVWPHCVVKWGEEKSWTVDANITGVAEREADPFRQAQLILGLRELLKGSDDVIVHVQSWKGFKKEVLDGI